MRKVFTSLLLAFLCLGSVNAQSVRQMWVDMPDSLCRYLDKNHRLELVELKEMGIKAEVKNLLNGQSLLDTLTADYLAVEPSKAMTMQLRRLPSASDSIFCLLTTWNGPARYSRLDFYGSGWQHLYSQDFDEFSPKDFIVHPDTMSIERYNELLKVPDPVLLSATLSPTDNSLELGLSLDLATKEEKAALEPLLSKRKLNWDLKIFK